jgi:hypothetical protein
MLQQITNPYGVVTQNKVISKNVSLVAGHWACTYS